MKRVLIGKIATAHGVRGDVKVVCLVEDMDLLFRPEGVFTSESKNARIVLSYKNALKREAIVCHIEGIDDRNAAERLRGTSLYIDEADLPTLQGDSVYAREIEGMDVVTPEGKPLGKALGVRNFGASDLLEIREGGGTFFIPFCAPYLIEIKKDARKIVLVEPEVL